MTQFLGGIYNLSRKAGYADQVTFRPSANDGKKYKAAQTKTVPVAGTERRGQSQEEQGKLPQRAGFSPWFIRGPPGAVRRSPWRAGHKHSSGPHFRPAGWEPRSCISVPQVVLLYTKAQI